MKRLAILALIAIMPAMAACHTVAGVGKDVKAVGHGIENTSGTN